MLSHTVLERRKRKAVEKFNLFPTNNSNTRSVARSSSDFTTLGTNQHEVYEAVNQLIPFEEQKTLTEHDFKNLETKKTLFQNNKLRLLFITTSNSEDDFYLLIVMRYDTTDKTYKYQTLLPANTCTREQSLEAKHINRQWVFYPSKEVFDNVDTIKRTLETVLTAFTNTATPVQATTSTGSNNVLFTDEYTTQCAWLRLVQQPSKWILDDEGDASVCLSVMKDVDARIAILNDVDMELCLNAWVQVRNWIVSKDNKNYTQLPAELIWPMQEFTDENESDEETDGSELGQAPSSNDEPSSEQGGLAQIESDAAIKTHLRMRIQMDLDECLEKSRGELAQPRFVSGTSTKLMDLYHSFLKFMAQSHGSVYSMNRDPNMALELEHITPVSWMRMVSMIDEFRYGVDDVLMKAMATFHNNPSRGNKPLGFARKSLEFAWTIPRGTSKGTRPFLARTVAYAALTYPLIQEEGAVPNVHQATSAPKSIGCPTYWEQASVIIKLCQQAPETWEIEHSMMCYALFHVVNPLTVCADTRQAINTASHPLQRLLLARLQGSDEISNTLLRVMHTLIHHDQSV